METAAQALVPIALCIGAILVAALAFSVVSAIKARGERRREQRALDAWQAQSHARRQQGGSHARPQQTSRGKHAR